MMTKNKETFENSTPAFTTHARLRCQQRGITETQVAYVLKNGRLIRNSGACFYFLAARDIPIADKKLDWVQKLVGATVLVNANGDTIITLYKKGQSIKDIRKKLNT